MEARRLIHRWSVLHLPNQKTRSNLLLRFGVICRMHQEPSDSFALSESEPLEKELLGNTSCKNYYISRILDHFPKTQLPWAINV